MGFIVADVEIESHREELIAEIKSKMPVIP